MYMRGWKNYEQVLRKRLEIHIGYRYTKYIVVILIMEGTKNAAMDGTM